MTDEIRSRFETVNDQLLGLGIALLQLILVVTVAALLAKAIRRRLRKRPATASSPTLAVILENSASVGVYVIAFTVVLALWGLTWTGLVTALSISTVAVAFGLQDLLRSVVGGLLVIVERPFTPGDRIKIREIEGRVEEIDLRTTILRSDNGDRITIPNALIFTEPVITRGSGGRQTILLTGIRSSADEAKRRAQDALAELKGFVLPPTVSVVPPRGRIQRKLDSVSGAKPMARQVGDRHQVSLRISWNQSEAGPDREAMLQRLASHFPDASIGGQATSPDHTAGRQSER